MATEVNEIPGQLIPLQGGNVVLPNSAVAEIVRYRDPHIDTESTATAPKWFVGQFEWRNQQIPIVSVEAAMGVGDDDHVPEQLVILRSLGLKSDLPYIAITARSVPRLVSIDRSNIVKEQDSDDKQLPFVLSHVLVNKEKAVIPDIDALERAIRKYRPQ